MATVLIADDNKQIVSVLMEYAKKEGYAVHAAFDGQQALELFGQVKPDVVLLDVMMPEMDGGTVAAAFAEEPQLARVPIIFLTAIVSKKEVEPTGSQIGSHTFLAKPVAFNDLLACIDGQLGQAG